MKRLFAVILAAGSSTRLGRDKLALRIDGVPVIRRAAGLFLDGPVEQVLVVAGRNEATVKKLVEGLAVTVVRNPAPERGMASSLKASLPFLGGAEGVFFHLGDKPFARTGIVGAMARAFEAEEAAIIVASHQGRAGHPVLIDTAPFMEEMGRVEGDKGLREVIEKHRSHVLCIEGGEECLRDIDTIQDIAALTERGYIVEEG